MTFKHKLSVRLALLKDALARVWPQLVAFLLPQLPQFVEGICLALLVALWRALDFKWWSFEAGDHRCRYHVTLPNGRRMRDRHPCRDFPLLGTRWRVRVALLFVHKVL